jgi:hypothetical protein
MSWVAKRQPTKVEDIAYCLLGIFDIQMPLIYGEREKAFRSLQEDITKVSDNQSIFAWMLLAVPDVDSVGDKWITRRFSSIIQKLRQYHTTQCS